MYITITKNLKEVTIYNGIDNCSGQLEIGLCEFSCTLKWLIHINKMYNNNTILEYNALNQKTTHQLQEGYYNFDTLSNMLKTFDITAEINLENLFVTLKFPAGKKFKLSGGLAKMLGFEVGQTYGSLKYTAARPIKIPKLYLYLNELNTTENLLDGNPSNLLEIISADILKYKLTKDNRFLYYVKEYPFPRFKQISKGFFENLSFSIKDENNELLELNEFNDLLIVLKIRV
jgi:hypothetical protein